MVASSLLRWLGMDRLLAFPAVFVGMTLFFFDACGGKSDTPSEPEAGSDAPAADSPPTTDGPTADGPTADGPTADSPTADGPATDGPTCPNEAGVVSCCCEGDVQASPICRSDGTLTCASPYSLYHGADCSCATGHGPCCFALSPLDASDAADAPIDSTDAVQCPPPMVWRYETAGCGAAANAICGPSGEDACLEEVCGCDGTTLSKCEYATAPWSHLGPCGDAALDQ
jgi:hypothetical protein